jgi:Zn-dependent protease with chaperone function
MRKTAAVLVIAVLTLIALPLLAQEPPPPPSQPSAAQGDASSPDPVPVPEPSEKAMRYYRSGNVLWVVGTLWAFLVPAALLFSGFSARLRDWAQRIGRNWFFTIVVYFILFTLVTVVIDLPLAYYTGFVRPHAYGLSNQTMEKWVSDLMKALLISLIFGALTLWLPYLLLRKSPRRWWLYTGILSIPLVVFLLLISPIWIDPLFNKFGPMKDKAMEARILALADRAGIEGGRVYEVEKSVDTETLNAYVAGLGDTKRIVLWDTLLRKMNDREVLFVMGHEMGHYVLHHTLYLIGIVAVLILLGLYFVHRFSGALIDRYQHRFRFRELADIASLPLLSLLFSLVLFLLTPAVLAIGRSFEHESDRFGLEITRDNHNAANAFVKLQQENLGNPRPGWLFKLWRSSHPPLGERIDFANEYRPWETGEPLRYGHLIEKGD